MSTQTDRLGGAKGSLAWKAPCRVATTANITLSGTQTIDGVAVVAEDRVLVKDQTTGAENGIYVCKSSVWVRAKDFDGNTEVVRGTRIYVTDGTAGQGEYTITNSTNPVVIGTDTITITKETPVTGPGSATDGNFATFSGTSGSIIQDSGLSTGSVLSTANIGSTEANGLQAYVAASTDVLTSTDIGSAISANAVQGYVGSTATVLTTADSGSTGTNNRAFEPSYGVAANSVSFNSTAGGTLTPNSDSGRFWDVTNNAGGGTITIAAPSNNGLIVLGITNSTAPGVFSTTAGYSFAVGSPTTENSATQMAIIWRSGSIQTIDWKTT